MSFPITIDSAGRILLPSAVRRRLNLRPGAKLMLDVVAERIELTPADSSEAGFSTAASGRKVLARTGEPFDAAAAVRGERQVRALPRKR
ncbi:MAG: AbrB/MazE/SpoVT family DNA-binding domain-containing protein [Gammaproteobacteria bacterium]|nr:AbrB/MazE/SpoVT family DNA-binding domain-containing protein [Gammaproteobacteria bacterium]